VIMPVLVVGETTITYSLRRSDVANRARITVTPEKVEIVVPTSASDADIAGVIDRRRGWLVEQTRAMAQRASATPQVAQYVTGAKIPFRGRMVRLKVEATDTSLVEVTHRNGFVVGCPRDIASASRDPLIESALRLWLRKRLRDDVAAFVRQHGRANGLEPRRVQIKDQKHLWGSCGVDRSINLNWQLIFAPKTVLEYAVVHELCHLRHRDHGSEFWSLVSSILPDWERRKAWLDQNEHFLTLRRVVPSA
jgi:predicted metal-dependent hydrolase